MKHLDSNVIKAHIADRPGMANITNGSRAMALSIYEDGSARDRISGVIYPRGTFPSNPRTALLAVQRADDAVKETKTAH